MAEKSVPFDSWARHLRKAALQMSPWVYICFCFQMGASSQISANTHFHQHVSILCKKAGARLRILQRLSSYIDEHYRMTIIFRSFVLINYCSLVWNFCETVHASKMERIQFRALKYIYNDVSTSYEELLARANLPTLELHRKREILVEVFKSVDNISPYILCGTCSK